MFLIIPIKNGRPFHFQMKNTGTKNQNNYILSCVIETCAKSIAITTLGMNTMHTVLCDLRISRGRFFAPYFGGQKLDLYAEKYGTQYNITYLNYTKRCIFFSV